MLSGMPPHPSLLDKTRSGDLRVPKHNLAISAEDLAKAGVNRPRFKPNVLARANAAGPFNMLVILVDFSDKTSQVAPVFFDSLVFAKTQSSVWRYYDENSYGSFDLVTVNYPSSTAWQRAPQTLSWYANGQYGFGLYPQNAQKLVEEVVDLVNPLVNFADYDNDGDGDVDGLTVVHSGQGAELTGNPDDIWSHKWGIIPRLRDGVYIFDYSMEPVDLLFVDSKIRENTTGDSDQDLYVLNATVKAIPNNTLDLYLIHLRDGRSTAFAIGRLKTPVPAPMSATRSPGLSAMCATTSSIRRPAIRAGVSSVLLHSSADREPSCRASVWTDPEHMTNAAAPARTIFTRIAPPPSGTRRHDGRSRAVEEYTDWPRAGPRLQVT